MVRFAGIDQGLAEVLGSDVDRRLAAGGTPARQAAGHGEQKATIRQREAFDGMEQP